MNGQDGNVKLSIEPYFKFLNPSVRNDLIQEFDHNILGGLPSEDQLEHIIVKKIRILKLIQHIVLIKLNIGHFG